MEFLIDALASVIKDPLEDPFLFEWIAIQSRGMKQWISIELAKKIGICANVKYFFPREILDKFSLKPNCDVSLLFWKILDSLPKLIKDKNFSSIKNYLTDDTDDIRLYQLTCNMASLFDDYRIYRPDILLKWQNDVEIFRDKKRVWAWQSVLFRKLVENGLENYSVQVSQEKDMPKRISVFGVSSYPPLFLNFFKNLSQFIDINLFLLVPSKEFFGYSTTHFEEDIDSGNPLVASLGKSGRDLQILIEDFEYYEPLPDLWHDPLSETETMLSYIQSDILNLYERKHGKDREPLDISFSNDNSISIHSCHTPMREVQVFKDQLLNLFEKNSDLRPDDVIVMMPDIESYAPLIETVFSSEHKFPYSISDRKQKSESKTVKAFLKIMNIMTSRFELHSVLDLLSMDPVAGKFLIDQTELGSIEKYAENAGIRWGIDSDHKKNNGLPEFNENTFKFGLQRLMLGYAMPNSSDTLFCNVLQASVPQGSEAEIIGKLALFLNTLFRGVKLFDLREKNISYFCKSFKQILNSMIAKTTDNEKEFLFILDSIQQIENESEKVLFNNKLSFAVALKILEEKLSKSVSAGSFMTGGITFCNLMPMRSIPFKVVGLMGMSEQDFPRKSSSRSFDLIEKYPRTGDKNVRSEDRYLFLEALISARENFIITYTGADIRDNSPMPCSAIVIQLIDVIMESFKIESEQDLICYHPLHPFNTKYFNKKESKKYFSFSPYAFKISKSLANRSDKKELFIHKTISQSDFLKEDISLIDLCYFFKHPLSYMMKNELGIVLQESEQIFQDREPVVLDFLDNYQIGSNILTKSVETKQLNLDYDRFKASGQLSFGKKGKIDLEEIYAQVAPIYKKGETIIKKDLMSSKFINIEFNSISISGTIDLIREDIGRLILTFGKLNPQRLLKAWIYHLALNASLNKEEPLKTVLVGKSAGKSKEMAQEIIFSEIDGNEAYILLSDLVKSYQSGLDTPFLFFPETSYEFVKYFLETDQDESQSNISTIMQKCKTKWYNSFFNTGDKTDRYTSKFFGEHDLFESIDYFISTGFIENSIKVLKPLMEHMR
jgi:exodeoxyribonuclease V gamma subunit